MICAKDQAYLEEAFDYNSEEPVEEPTLAELMAAFDSEEA